MKATCVKEKIRNAVSLADRVTGRNPTLPILSSILILADGELLKIRATNLDLGLEITIPAKIEKNGVVAIPGNILNSFLSNIYNDDVVVFEHKDNLSISTKNSSTIINSFPYDDFPTLPSVGGDKYFTIPAQKLVSGLKSVYYSASISDIKPEISSVYIYFDSGDIIFVSTDSFRLAEKRIKLNYSGNNDSIIIPYKNITEIIRVFESLTEDIQLSFNNNQIAFKGSNIYLTSRLVNGVFPDYKQIIPKDFSTEAVLLKQDLNTSLKLVNLFSDKFNQINMKISPENKLFELSSKNTNIGENKTFVNAAISGNKIDLNFNYKYIMDCIPFIERDSILLKMNGDGKPLVVQGVGDQSFTYLIMPLNQ